VLPLGLGFAFIWDDVGVNSAFMPCESVNYNALFPLMFLGERESLTKNQGVVLKSLLSKICGS
ncbi:MAG: hypothetical protein WBN88_14480, partial [Anderseniella sp.]